MLGPSALGQDQEQIAKSEMRKAESRLRPDARAIVPRSGSGADYEERNAQSEKRKAINQTKFGIRIQEVLH
jgi:hypothetical protein